jgi:predicted peptidase
MRGSVVAVCLLLTSASARADMRALKMSLADGGELLYGLSVPDNYKASQPRALIVALHPGGARMPYYGRAYARSIVEPAAAELGAIIVAPDCPSAAWTDEAADTAVMALVDRVTHDYTIDRRRILIVGFSMGGRGTWFMASHHPKLFTAAIPMAASTGSDPVESLATMPTYIIHSRRDQVVPFAPAERNAQELARLGRVVQFEALTEPTHFEMGAYVPALRRAMAWVNAQWNTAR